MTPGEPVARKTPLWVPDNSHGGGGVKEELYYSGPLVNTMGKNQSQKPSWSLGALSMAVVPSLLQWLERYAARWPYGYMARCLHGLRAT